ncbi:hypothetical protein HYH03_000627 [Edaphochlamys debaryana]|uniref:N-acetyltransferase domain-containing protein n=1 Tax=Edaphochlamys debaryana TaxID=47281 RepID=A0A835YHY3_9CHLO|nr:hypothetical protein HYH03_000627 [Edaphochlamys debaryana]|eukprot:KAG2502139.1 hypothetical protein HYH03_000627 [Edaphochlamys debaryana]
MSASPLPALRVRTGLARLGRGPRAVVASTRPQATSVQAYATSASNGSLLSRAWRRSRSRTAIGCTAAVEEASASASSTVSASTSAPVDAPPAVSGAFPTRRGRVWVRPYVNSDYQAIVDVQTDSFHNANPVPFLHEFTLKNFRAEVVDALRQKIKHCDPYTFMLLVAEELAPGDDGASSSTSSGAGGASVEGSTSGEDDGSGAASGSGRRLVGVVEVSIMDEKPVLRQLPSNRLEYAYVSSMCVAGAMRRQGVAQALMAAAEEQARLWRQSNLALHVYKDNAPAVQLYNGCGMRVLGEDPGWKVLFGDRVRLLMYKNLPLPEEGRAAEGEAQPVEEQPLS